MDEQSTHFIRRNAERVTAKVFPWLPSCQTFYGEWKEADRKRQPYGWIKASLGRYGISVCWRFECRFAIYTHREYLERNLWQSSLLKSDRGHLLLEWPADNNGWGSWCYSRLCRKCLRQRRFCFTWRFAARKHRRSKLWNTAANDSVSYLRAPSLWSVYLKRKNPDER